MLAGTLKGQEIARNNQKVNGTIPMNDLSSDMELMKAIFRRDGDAFHRLYLDYGQCMFAYALRITNDPDKAEDVLQDTLVVVWNSAGSFKGTNRLKAWLLGIVHHTAVKSLRHLSHPITDEMEETVGDTGQLPEDQIQSREAVSNLQTSLDQLSPEHRAVLDLVFYQGLTLTETAAVLDCPVGTVKSRLSYARNRLKGLMAGMEDLR